MTSAFRVRAAAEAEAARLAAEGFDVTLLTTQDGTILVTARPADPAGAVIVLGGFLIAAIALAAGTLALAGVA